MRFSFNDVPVCMALIKFLTDVSPMFRYKLYRFGYHSQKALIRVEPPGIHINLTAQVDQLSEPFKGAGTPVNRGCCTGFPVRAFGQVRRT